MQAHSLRSGVLEALSQQAEAAVVLLADQPFVSVQMINRLITEYTQGAAANRKHLFVASGYQGLPHPPVLFARELFPDLLRLKGDEGARRLLPKESLFQGKTIGYTDARLFLDIDTEEDYRLLKFLH